MSPAPKELYETDVLVVGGGLAGCWAALRARDLTPRVTLVDKGVVARSGDTIFCHEILAPMPEGQQEAWIRDLMEHTEYLGNEQFLEVLVREIGARIKEMADWGVPFERDDKGQLFLTLGRGHRASRVVLCDCRKMMEVMRQEALRRGVELVERVMVTDLLTSDGRHPTAGRVAGAVGLNTRSGDFVVFKAKAVILCTGVVSFKLHSSFADNLTGDAQAMAFRAGARLAGLEFNFSAKFVALHRGRPIITSLMPLQTKGAYLLNAQGERFMGKYVPDKMEQLSHFGTLALAAAKELLEGRGPLYFDVRHFGLQKLAQLKRVLPVRLAPLYEVGLDPAKDLIEAKPLVLYLGGRAIWINMEGETTIPGLFAGGVCVQFPGCVEPLSGATLAICAVYGHRAGERAAALARERDDVPYQKDQVGRLRRHIFSPLEKERGLAPKEIYRKLAAKLVRPEYSIMKNETSIKEMLAEIKKVAQEDLPRLSASHIHELVMANEARNFVTLLEPLYLSCLQRTESRLRHYRADYPSRDDINWLKWIMVEKQDSQIRVTEEPVPVETNRIKPAQRLKVPNAVAFSIDSKAVPPI